MKIYVTGYLGKLGRHLVSLGAIPLDCDVRDKDSISRNLKGVDFDVIIHCAGKSKVDECETKYGDAILVNVRGTNNICEVAEGKVVVMSSDYVFDGKKFVGKYKESDKPNPVNNYGFTKLGAEQIAKLFGCKIIRLARTFSLNDHDITTYIKTLSNGGDVHVPDFFIRNYQSSYLASRGIMHFAKNFNDMPDILHYGGESPISFYEFMRRSSVAIIGNSKNVKRRGYEIVDHTRRPHNLSMSINLAKQYGLPIYNIDESINYEKINYRHSLS